MACTCKGTTPRSSNASESKERKPPGRSAAAVRRSVCEGPGMARQSRQAHRDVEAVAGDNKEGKGSDSKDGEAGRGAGEERRQSALHAANRAFGSGFNEEMFLADGFEEAFIGVVERCGQPSLACYDIEKCIGVLTQRDGMTYEDAQECFFFNTLGAWLGENTPVFLTRFNREDWVSM